MTGKKILHYLQLYITRPDPIAFLSVVVDTTGRIYDDFSRLLYLHVNRESLSLTNEIPEESDRFRFLRADCYANIKGSVGLILTKVSDVRISIPLDLSSRSFIPLPCFIRSRRPLPLLSPSLVFTPRCSAFLLVVVVVSSVFGSEMGGSGKDEMMCLDIASEVSIPDQQVMDVRTTLVQVTPLLRTDSVAFAQL